MTGVSFSARPAVLLDRLPRNLLFVADPLRLLDHLPCDVGNERGRQVDLVNWDLLQSELVRGLHVLLAVDEPEHPERAQPSELHPRIAVHVREDEVQVLLREVVEAHALDQDLPHLDVVALDASLLPGLAGIAVEHPAVLRERLERLGIAELRPPVAEQDPEHHRVLHVEERRMDLRDRVVHGLGVLVVEQDAEHHHRLHVEERHDDLAALASLKRVHLRDAPDRELVRDEELHEVLEATPLAARLVDLVLAGLALPRPDHARTGLVSPLALRESPLVHVPVERPQAAVEAGPVRRVGHEDRTPVLQSLLDQAVVAPELLARDERPRVRRAPELAGLLVRDLGRVVGVQARAPVDIRAVVADVRGLVVVLPTPLGYELLAVAVAKPALAALPGAALAALADAENTALVAFHAPVLAAEAACPFVLVVAVRLDLAHDRRAGHLRLMRDLRNLFSLKQPVFDYNTLRQGEMFLHCHLDFLSCCCLCRNTNDPTVARCKIGNLFV